MKHYQAGDIVGVKSTGITGKLNTAIFTPHTRLFHFAIIYTHIAREDDYIILHSTDKGIGVGRLSWYKDYRVFRLTKNIDIQLWGRIACANLTKLGKAKYDYLIFVKLLFGCLRAWLAQLLKDGRFRAIKPKELHYARDRRFTCTEAVNEAWRSIGFPIIPKGVVPLPAGIIQALIDKKLKEVTASPAVTPRLIKNARRKL